MRIFNSFSVSLFLNHESNPSIFVTNPQSFLAGLWAKIQHEMLLTFCIP